MHELQPKHLKLKNEEVVELLRNYNISIAQLPKISRDDPCVSENSEVGDVFLIERVNEDKTIEKFYRTVS